MAITRFLAGNRGLTKPIAANVPKDVASNVVTTAISMLFIIAVRQIGEDASWSNHRSETPPKG